jgi:hypothetical protein
LENVPFLEDVLESYGGTFQRGGGTFQANIEQIPSVKNEKRTTPEKNEKMKKDPKSISHLPG